ncbi:hypothetical protein Q9R20_12270 [Microbacterium sp. PRF11]|uniref:hypothetical protein n=1 Tax=Microbacterium sp. PRF11 TaxID=2962593 RepID=UPI002881419B|nr:hypothetical protein [Microbacterium sp. PRF11]MDT0117764.1 hypothetical protein [Microbacterium sp. PRF11]
MLMLSEQWLRLDDNTTRIITGQGPKVLISRLSEVPFNVEPCHGQLVHCATQMIPSEESADVIVVTEVPDNFGRILSHVRRHLKNVGGPRPHDVGQRCWLFPPGDDLP